MNVEQLFDVYKVATDLKALLIMPYLNDKAMSIVSKLTPDVGGDYLRLKGALLHEHKLSPNTYLKRFNSCRKSGEETFVAFASRLKGLLNYYLDSRYVTDFTKLCELLVCDRIKSTWSDSCLQYVLSIESVAIGPALVTGPLITCSESVSMHALARADWPRAVRPAARSI